MGTEHTPGPWVIREAKGPDGEHCFFDIEVANAGKYRGNVASVSDAENISGITRDEAKANARLISAAPLLLKTLSDIAAFANGYGDVCEIIASRARAAIREAIES